MLNFFLSTQKEQIDPFIESNLDLEIGFKVKK